MGSTLKKIRRNVDTVETTFDTVGKEVRTVASVHVLGVLEGKARKEVRNATKRWRRARAK
jgi:hypothetical protein